MVRSASSCVERAVEEAIRKGLEEMLGSRLAEAFYTTLVNYVKALRGYRSLLERPEVIVMFLRRNFGEASPKYEERIAELIEEELRLRGLGDHECKHRSEDHKREREREGEGERRRDLLSLLKSLAVDDVDDDN